jgi:hypothetical protein
VSLWLLEASPETIINKNDFWHLKKCHHDGEALVGHEENVMRDSFRVMPSLTVYTFENFV